MGGLDIANGIDEQTVLGSDALGRPKGTVLYMSPEKAKGMSLDERSDLYSLAATLNEALTGCAQIGPRLGESLAELRMLVATPGAFDEAVPGPDALADWFATALAPQPEDRFASAREMHEAYEASGTSPRGPVEPGLT